MAVMIYLMMWLNYGGQKEDGPRSLLFVCVTMNDGDTFVVVTGACQ